MALPYTIYFVDTETTGLEKFNSIIELSLFRLNDERQMTWCLTSDANDNISTDALRVNGHKLEDIKHMTAFGKETYKAPSKVLPEIENWMLQDNDTPENRIFIAQNSQFDLQFMLELWRRENCVDTFPWGNRPKVIDTIQFQLILDLAHNEKSPYLNLGSLVDKYKVKKLKAHKAAEDTIMMKDVFLAQMKTIQQLQKQANQ